MKLFFVFAFASFLIIGCTYSKKEVDYPITVTCDTNNIKFNTYVLPLLNSKCSISGCHNSASTAGGWAMDSYLGVKDVLDNSNGRFLKSIQHESPASPMPKGGNKLPDCDISKIKAWINAGALEN